MQYGQTAATEFYGFKLGENLPSSWTYFPTRTNPSTRYKYVSIEYNVSMDVTQVSRSTYHVLDWIGDIGGLLDAARDLAISRGCDIYVVGAANVGKSSFMNRLFNAEGGQVRV